jgi:hypothetical protein
MSSLKLLLNCCHNKARKPHTKLEKAKIKEDIIESVINQPELSNCSFEEAKGTVHEPQQSQQEVQRSISIKRGESVAGSEFTFVKEPITPEKMESIVLITPEIEVTIPKLKLRVIESYSIPQNTCISISAAGYAGSARNARDGKTFFGTAGVSYGIDYSIAPELGFGKKHFVIYYSLSN